MPRMRRRVRDHVGPGRENIPRNGQKCPENSKKCPKMPKNAPERSKNRPFCTFCPVFYCFRAHFSLFPIDPADILPRPACIPAAFFPAAFFDPSPARCIFPHFSPVRSLFNLSPVPRAGIGGMFCAFQTKKDNKNRAVFSRPGLFLAVRGFYAFLFIRLRLILFCRIALLFRNNCAVRINNSIYARSLDDVQIRQLYGVFKRCRP